MRMLMCWEATRLMSKRLDIELGFQERMSLKFHLAMCGACRNCNRHFQLIHDAGRWFEKHGQDESSGTAPEAR